MKSGSPARRRVGRVSMIMTGLVLAVIGGVVAFKRSPGLPAKPSPARVSLAYEPRTPGLDTSGFMTLVNTVPPWPRGASLQEVSRSWGDIAPRSIRAIDEMIAGGRVAQENLVPVSLTRALYFNAAGDPAAAYKALGQVRAMVEAKDDLAAKHLYTVVYCQGVSALRRGETENCVMCRGESSCILPIAASARHQKPEGSRLAIQHFNEYLERFPGDLEVRWLLNLAYMTLGEYPDKVEPKYLVSLDRWLKSEFDIGKFRDVGEKAGVNRFNQSGGAVMEDFDNDGLLDLAVTSIDPTVPMAFHRNAGDGTFEDRSESAGVTGQLGGLYCVQTDYNNDGLMDLYIPRGAWISNPIRPSLLRNDGGTFTDVTEAAGLLDPVNSNSATWADYDNDGWLDLFVCCERQPNRLYHNKGDGTFAEVGSLAGVAGDGNSFCKGAAWLDFDNDGDPDLFLNNLNGKAEFFRNMGGGLFQPARVPLGIDGPSHGFSCWAWDYDNDGWLDLFATCYERTVTDVVKGMLGEPHTLGSNRLFRNKQGKGFEDVTRAAGLDMVFATMGSNYGDFDNDGFLDMYLGTGEPHISTLVPNRMFKNVAGRRFSEITASSGTGHLQKGHSVACGDWDRDGDVDLFVQMGGPTNGDMYHNVLFANPGQGNHWLTVKLVGKKTNRAAIGARLKVVTAGDSPMTVQRHVSSGSSFGGNTLQQTIGLAGSRQVATLEVDWPTSGTKQVFRDIPADRAIEVTEFADSYRVLDGKPISSSE